MKEVRPSEIPHPKFIDDFVKLEKEGEFYVVLLTCPDLVVDPVIITYDRNEFSAFTCAVTVRFIVAHAYRLASEHATTIAKEMGQPDLAETISHMQSNLEMAA
jgi:hypothetical protein